VNGEQAYTDEANGYDADRYAMYEEIGRIKATTMIETMNQLAAMVRGMGEQFNAVRAAAPRPEDDTRLPFDTAWECAWVEYTARMGATDWQRLYEDARNERDAHKNALRVTARELEVVTRANRDLRAHRERDRTTATITRTKRSRDLRNALGMEPGDWSAMIERVAALKAREAESEPATVVKALERRIRILEQDVKAANEGAAQADRALREQRFDLADAQIRLARTQSLVRDMLRVVAPNVPESITDMWRERLARNAAEGSGREAE
jgi:hypothetical protein